MTERQIQNISANSTTSLKREIDLQKIKSSNRSVYRGKLLRKEEGIKLINQVEDALKTFKKIKLADKKGKPIMIHEFNLHDEPYRTLYKAGLIVAYGSIPSIAFGVLSPTERALRLSEASIRSKITYVRKHSQC